MIETVLQFVTMILLGGCINKMRGTGRTWYAMGSKTFTSAMMALSTYFILDTDYITIGIIYVGLLLWLSTGWGKYFTAYSGLAMNHNSEQEVFWIDSIIRKFEDSNDFHYNCNVGALAMTLRGLYFTPMVSGLAIYTGDYKDLLYIPVIAMLQGFSYTIMRFDKKDPLAGAEWCMGWSIGLILTLILN